MSGAGALRHSQSFAGRATFPILRERLSGILLLSDEEIKDAVRLLLLRAKLLVEPTGAVPVAALLAGRLPLAKGARVGVVLSGGDVDPGMPPRGR